MQAASSAAAAAGVINSAHLFSAEVLDVRAEMNAPASSLPTKRFKPVPNYDAFLRYLSQDTFHLHPPTFPRSVCYLIAAYHLMLCHRC